MNTPFDKLADEILQTLANCFPVCLYSDEFHFFPQFIVKNHDWSKWDDFSFDTVKEIIKKLSLWESSLIFLHKKNIDDQILLDISMFLRTIQTIKEQLDIVQTHKTQPSFYLSIAGIGLAEALSFKKSAFDARIKNLPRFFDTAISNLSCIPYLYNESGLDMTNKLESWLLSLNLPQSNLSKVFEALQRFKDHLGKVWLKDSFILDKDIVQTIVSKHFGCNMDIKEIFNELELEIYETKKTMIHYSKKINKKQSNKSWQETMLSFPLPYLPDNGLKCLYSFTIKKLAKHCVSKKIVNNKIVKSNLVSIEPIPEYLLGIRSADAYTMPLPLDLRPKGGTFYIDSKDNFVSPPIDYDILTSHETYPGHHLLDTSRWLLKRKLRRHFEFPLFYEGWACFAETLMFDTGFFNGDKKRFLLAKRRFSRALRGKADLGLHCREYTIEQAAKLLTKACKPMDKTLSMVKRYALKPCYQICYTIGVRNFCKIYKKFLNSDNKNKADGFARKVLSKGQIEIDKLI